MQWRASVVVAAVVAAAAGNGTAVYSTPLYGGINDYAYYFVDVLVGSPAVRQSVILDSGSSLLGFPCTTCGRRCGRHIDNPFDVKKSATSELYSCHDRRCVSTETCNDTGQCRYSQVYSEGSSIEGYFFSDVLSLAPYRAGGTSANPQVRYDYIGCHNKETVLFTSQQASGILGVSFPRGGKQPTVMDAFMSSPGVERRQFAICASEDGGVLSIGGYDVSLHRKSFSKNASASFTSRWLLRGWNRLPYTVDEPSDAVVWTRMVNNNAYSIKVSGVSSFNPHTKTHEKIVDRGFGEVLVDSGTTYTYLPNEVYQKVARYLIDMCNTNNQAPESQRAGSCMRSKQDLICFDFSNTGVPVPTLLERIPSLSLELGDGSVVEWKPDAYLFRKADNIWCSALENNRRSQTILGMSFLKQKQVVFDRESHQIGFVSATCPSFTSRVLTGN